jgi:hypothetical protein
LKTTRRSLAMHGEAASHTLIPHADPARDFGRAHAVAIVVFLSKDTTYWCSALTGLPYNHLQA